MITSFVKRPATTVMFVLLFALLGSVAFFEINVERQPRIDLPMVMVRVTYPGASPEEVESQVLTKIEDAVVEISSLDKVQGRAYENFGYVLLEFKLSADVNIKAIEVKDKVEGILKELPDDVDRPIVQKLDPFATSVVDLVLASDKHSSKDLYEYADKHLKGAFSRVPGVGKVDIFGGQKREVKIELLPDLMRQKFIGVDAVMNQLRARNLNIPAGNINQGTTAVGVRFEGEFKSIEDIANLRLTTSEGNRFKLSDIANVYDGSEEATSIARYNGHTVVTLAVKKTSDGNTVAVSKGILASIPGIQKSLPEGMSLKMAQDQSVYVVRETNNTIKSIVVGLFMTIIILLFFTGDWRTTVIAGVVIPSSIISAMFLVQKSGFTINFITLLALATSLGTLIANSIVVIESVLAQLEKGKDRVDAAIDGTKDAFIPVLAACGTNLVVFTPIAFMGGIVGQFMLQFGMTVVYTTIFSLMASFTLTPMMCAVMLKNIDKDAKRNFVVRMSNAFVGWLLSEYKILYNAIFKLPSVSLILLVAIFAGSFSVLPYVGNEFIPTSDQDKITVQLTMPQGSKVERTKAAAEEVEKKLREIPEVIGVLTVIGESGEENAKIAADLSPAAGRLKSDVQIIADLTEFFATIPDAEVEVIRGVGGGGRGGDISLNVSGQDYDTMVGLSKQAVQVFQDSGYFRSVTSSHKDPKMELKFYPDQSKLERYGVSNSSVASVVRTAVFGDNSAKFKQDGQEYDIVMEVDKRFKTSPEDLSDIFVVGSVGLVPLGELGEFRLEKSVPMLMRRDRERVIQLNGYLAKSTAGVVQGELTKKLAEIKVPPGYAFDFVGNAEAQQETGREIAKAFLLAVILTYMLLAAVMNSFLHPFTISVSIFTAYAGVFLGLFFLDSSINIASMLGIVMMVGLAVNNAILILEEVEKLLKDDPNLPIKDGLWQGITSKFRAVLMTSVAVVFGVLPQVWSPDLPKASMGIVIAGGMLASIFFTLFLTPIVYYYAERMKRWTRRNKGKETKVKVEPYLETKPVFSPEDGAH